MNRPLSAIKVYLFIDFAMMFVSMSLYEVTVANLTPLQLVLVGTTLEVSAFVFEVPTGIVADMYSRRTSIIIGYMLMGFGFLLEGFYPFFVPILLAQVIWGLGYTFTSGATEAWITDEIGEGPANNLFLRATQVGLTASLLGMLAAALIGSQDTAIPIRAGGLGVILIGVVLVFIMPETGFRPTPREDRDNLQQMQHTFYKGIRTVRTSPRLMSIVGVGLFYGLYSEGFDRLWVKLLLENFKLPTLFGANQVAFFATLKIIGTVLAIFAMHYVEKRVNTGSPLAIGRAMLSITALICAALMGFALVPILLPVIGLYLVIHVLRKIAIPLTSAWINQNLDSQVRATVHSMFGQVDAIGQIAGGPGVGLLANLASVAAAVTTSGALLTPALFLIGRANRQSERQVQAGLEETE
jgi:DHA3 family tetracycline resistance protein-like MFS transporter